MNENNVKVCPLCRGYGVLFPFLERIIKIECGKCNGRGIIYRKTQLHLINSMIGTFIMIGAILLMGIPASKISDEFGIFYGILTLIVLDVLCLFSFTEWMKSEERLMFDKYFLK